VSEKERTCAAGVCVTLGGGKRGRKKKDVDTSSVTSCRPGRAREKGGLCGGSPDQGWRKTWGGKTGWWLKVHSLSRLGGTRLGGNKKKAFGPAAREKFVEIPLLPYLVTGGTDLVIEVYRAPYFRTDSGRTLSLWEKNQLRFLQTRRNASQKRKPSHEEQFLRGTFSQRKRQKKDRAESRQNGRDASDSRDSGAGLRRKRHLSKKRKDEKKKRGLLKESTRERKQPR